MEQASTRDMLQELTEQPLGARARAEHATRPMLSRLTSKMPLRPQVESAAANECAQYHPKYHPREVGMRQGIGAPALPSGSRPSDQAALRPDASRFDPSRSRPRLLDLFCKAGGAAMGYHRAGFVVVGIDIEPQPNYPFEFIQADALTLDSAFIASFDAIHASPPCQDYSALKGLALSPRGKMIDPARDLLCKAGLPWVIENVVGSDLRNPITLCGSSFGLGVWRHRKFETSFPIVLTPQCRHTLVPEPIDVTGTGGPFNGVRKTTGGGISRKPRNLSHAREVMGIDWMNRRELSQAIPPAFTQFIGEHLLSLMAERAAA